MNKMNMPGFTAGASLYPAVSNYRTFSISNVPCDVLVPQMTLVQRFMLEFALSAGDGDGGGGGGGGGSTGGLSDCLVSCYRSYTDCMGSGLAESRFCSRIFERCNAFCFSPFIG